MLHQIGHVHAGVVTGKSFFPSVISAPFEHGLEIAFAVSALLCALAAAFSWWAGDCRPDPVELAEAQEHETFVGRALHRPPSTAWRPRCPTWSRV